MCCGRVIGEKPPLILVNKNTLMNRDGYLRVTTILYPFSGLQHVDTAVLQAAADRGTRVHKVCELIAREIGEFGVEDDIWGYVESFKKWWETGIQPLHIEERFWDDENRITGQMDLIIDFPDGKAIVDLKTSSKPSKTWPVQGAAYAYLAKKCGHDIKKVFFLHLNKHGKDPKLHDYPVDDELFLSVFRAYNHFFREPNDKT